MKKFAIAIAALLILGVFWRATAAHSGIGPFERVIVPNPPIYAGASASYLIASTDSNGNPIGVPTVTNISGPLYGALTANGDGSYTLTLYATASGFGSVVVGFPGAIWDFPLYFDNSAPPNYIPGHVTVTKQE